MFTTYGNLAAIDILAPHDIWSHHMTFSNSIKMYRHSIGHLNKTSYFLEIGQNDIYDQIMNLANQYLPSF